MFFALSTLKHTALVVGGCNLVGYGITAVLETHKLTDLVGCGSFVVATLSLSNSNGLLANIRNGNFSHSKIIAINLAIVLWGSRLATYLFHRVLNVGEDKRLDKFFRRPGEKYLDLTGSFYPIKLSSFWLIQAMWSFICLLPVTFLNAMPQYKHILKVAGVRAVGSWEALPIAGIFVGIIMETVADWQKSSYRSDPRNDGHWCDKGLWKICRYPNYFGEMLTWWSVYLSCMPMMYRFIEANLLYNKLPASLSNVLPPFMTVALLSALSPAFITFLLLKVSGVPLLEVKYQQQYKGNKEYQEYVASTPLLVPFSNRFERASRPSTTGYDVIMVEPERLVEVSSQSSEKYAQATASSSSYNNSNNHPDNNDWSTGLTSCSLDWESCWWSAWCCCLVSARNKATFNLGSSIVEVRNIILFLLIIFILFRKVSIILALLLAVVGSVWYAYSRSSTRTTIRRQLHIRGSECDDFVFHLFLPWCSIAQEAREADIKIDKKLDLISGDDLSSIVFPQHPSNHLDNRQASDSNSSSESSLSSSLLSRLNTVSSTSRWIITFSMLVAIRFLVSIVLFGDPLNIAVLVLVFAQPVLILYLFYWRYHRSHASLDYVIKLFAVGFFMSTFQSLVFETILEAILGFVFLILLMLVDPQVVRKGNEDADSASTSPKSFLEALLPSSSSRMTDSASSLRLRQLVHSTVHVMHGGLHSETAAKGVDGSEDDDGGIFSPDVVRRNFPLVVVALLVMAFVIAAGVEETMKHFAIRCCRFPAALRDPHSIRIYLMTAALGFATAENIEYVFGSKRSPFAGTSAVEGELLILLIRIAMPVHIICSVLQSITLSKVLMGLSNYRSIFYVLFPAIFLHGLYDFSLFLMTACDVAFHVDVVALTIASFAIPFAITVGGVAWAYYGFQAVNKAFDDGFSLFPSEEPLPDVRL